MAEPELIPPPGTVDQVKKLKYLDFVQAAALYVGDRLSTVYESAKEKSGPLKSVVQTVESTVKTVIGPVYDKFHGVPFELLNFVDCKVDELITEVDRHVPSLIKQASSQARAAASEVQQAGVVNAAKNIAKKVYTEYEVKVKKYRPLANHYAVLAWSTLTSGVSTVSTNVESVAEVQGSGLSGVPSVSTNVESVAEAQGFV